MEIGDCIWNWVEDRGATSLANRQTSNEQLDEATCNSKINVTRVENF